MANFSIISRAIPTRLQRFAMLAVRYLREVSDDEADRIEHKLSGNEFSNAWAEAGYDTNPPETEADPCWNSRSSVIPFSSPDLSPVAPPLDALKY